MGNSLRKAAVVGGVVSILVLWAAAAFIGCDTKLLQSIKEDVEKAQYVGTPKLVVTQGATVIEAGETYDLFEDTPTNAVDSQRQFVVRNDGDGDLLLTGAVAVSLSGDPEFTIGTNAPTSYGPKDDPDDEGTFSLLFNPKAVQSYSTSLTIQSNDPTQGVFTFTVTGNGTTPDTTKPQIVSKNPLSDAIGVPVDTNITVTFSEAMSASVATDAIFKLYATAPPSSLVAATRTLQSNATVVVLDPSSNLSPETQYTAEFHEDAADLAGNPLVGAPYKWNFTTTGVPVAPTLTSPASGTTGLGTSVTLSWSSVSGATAYVVYCDTSDPPTTARTNTSYSSTSYTMSTSYSTRYYWKVRAWNAVGLGSPSSVWHFDTLYPPASGPTLNSPANGATGYSPFPKFAWATVAGATGYDVYRGTSSPPTTLLKGVTVLYCYPSAPLAYGTKHYWAVFAKNAAGSGPSSEIRNVTTRNDVRFPADGSTGVLRTPIEADWPATASASSYNLYLRPYGTTTWGSPVAQPTTHYYFDLSPAAPLPANTKFEWKYQAYTKTGPLGLESAVWSFTTGP